MRESLVKSWAWILVMALPTSMLMADATSAMLRASGNVSVNGSPIEQATAIFPGDRVQTSANSIATLTNEGSSVTMPGNSSLVFSRSFVNVLCGTALVTTRRGMSVRVSNLLVQPARGEQARFQVTQKEGELQIIAREGTLAIDNGAATSSLQPGRMLTASAACMAAPYAEDQTASNSPTAQDQGQQDNKRHAPPGGGGRSTPPPTGGSNTSALWLYAAGAGGAAGFLVWLTTRSSSSCTTPNCQ